MGRDEIFNVIKRVVSEILPDVDSGAVTQDKSLKELGANSIDRVEIVTMVLENLNIKMSPVELGGISNIEGLVDALFKKVNSSQ
ncbi:MAG: acyl carrier protein [Acetivibrionales bacterium]